jgi:glycosyltransferase involved in cell wall biosynthesis
LIQKIRSGISLADKLIVSTPGLAEAFNGWHQYIQVLELKLPPDWWLNLEIIKTDHKKPRVGWAGGSSHLGDLELIFDVVKNLANEVDWVFFGMCPEQLRPYIKELHYGVDIDSYPQKLASLNLDLALAPLENNHFNDCKSNLRLLEYGACGYPVVCSNTRSYVESNLSVCIVKNRYKDWVEAIRNHANDLKSSLLLGEQLKKEVQLNWMLRDSSLKSWKESWLM